MKATLCYNSKSGLDLGKDRLTYLSELIEQYAEIIRVYDVTETEDYEFSGDVLIIAGGDGTVSRITQLVYDKQIDIPILVLPLGSTNDIAFSHKIPSQIDEAVCLLEDFKVKDIDLGLINEKTIFFYALTFGNFTEVTYKTPQKLKNRLGHQAYWLYGFLRFRGISHYKMKLWIDDQLLESNDYVFGSISNAHRVANIFNYEDNSLCDGLMELLFIRRPRKVHDLHILAQSFLKRDYEAPLFLKKSIDRIKLESTKPIAWNIDGEYGGESSDLTVRVIKKAIKIIVKEL